ncbi:MAG: hypothetical protein M1114_03980 [Candidatus Dependentiae bacterium]|nr:hypothetical protein [Candidatus Dependentiae bacterium]
MNYSIFFLLFFYLYTPFIVAPLHAMDSKPPLSAISNRYSFTDNGEYFSLLDRGQETANLYYGIRKTNPLVFATPTEKHTKAFIITVDKFIVRSLKELKNKGFAAICWRITPNNEAAFIRFGFKKYSTNPTDNTINILFDFGVDGDPKEHLSLYKKKLREQSLQQKILFITYKNEKFHIEKKNDQIIVYEKKGAPIAGIEFSKNRIIGFFNTTQDQWDEYLIPKAIDLIRKNGNKTVYFYTCIQKHTPLNIEKFGFKTSSSKPRASLTFETDGSPVENLFAYYQRRDLSQTKNCKNLTD